MSAPKLAVGAWNVLAAAREADCLHAAWCEESRAGRLRGAGIEPRIVAADELRRRFGAEARGGFVAEVRLPEAQSPEALVAAAIDKARPLVVLEEVQDPQNLGSILRAAAALGAVGVIVTRHRAAPWSAAVARASAGQIFRVPRAEVGGVPNWLTTLPDDLPTIAALAEGGCTPDVAALAGACVLLLGAEGDGLKPLTVKRATQAVTIPLAGAVDSLNVAQAATIFLYEALRRRGNAV